MLVTYAQIWRHLRLRGAPPADGGDDLHIKMLATAAQRKIENDTNRKLFADVDSVPADAPDNALVIEDDIRLALLMLMSHWHEHPEAVGEGSQTYVVPLAYEALVGPYRWFSL